MNYNKNKAQVMSLVILSLILLFIISCEPSSPESITATVIEKPLPPQEQLSFKLLSSGLAQDAIPPIDNPQFVSVEEANQWLKDNDLVIALIHKDVIKVYPIAIMNWHEIVNDNIAGDPMVVTYCPLCGSAAVYQRKIVIDGSKKTLSFGNTGKVYNSNFIMYDHNTNSYWTQFDGKAIMGELAGKNLPQINTHIVNWRDWKSLHPKSKVLSQNTGFSRSYDKDPYPFYNVDETLLFPVEKQSPLLPIKEVIFGISVENKEKAYPESILKKKAILHDTLSGARVKIQRDETGSVIATNLENGLILPVQRSYWFSWYAFHPETQVYSSQD